MGRAASGALELRTELLVRRGSSIVLLGHLIYLVRVIE